MFNKDKINKGDKKTINKEDKKMINKMKICKKYQNI